MSCPRLCVLGLVVVAACGDNREGRPDAAIADAVPAPDAPPALLDRIVAIGGSLTAGVEGYGIAPSTQTTAYPTRVAIAAGVEFRVPLLAGPCPAPATAPLMPMPAAGSCALASDDGPFQNLAVPGARVIDALDKPAAPTELETLFVGASTQLAALAAQAPTFAIVELGIEDVLQPALAGEAGLLTAAEFATRYDRVEAALAATSTLQGAVLVGVYDPTRFTPVLQPGAYFFLARDAQGRFNGKPVNANCSPVTALGQPNPLAANLVAMTIVRDAAFTEINCDPAAYPVGDARRGRFLLDASERATLSTRVVEYNAIISAAADEHGWGFVDPTVLLNEQRMQRVMTTRYNAMRVCQDLPTAQSASAFQAAILNSCPVTGPTEAPSFFGSFYSFDGVHPSAAGQALIAEAVTAEIDATY